MYHDFDGDGSGQYFGRSVDIDFTGTTFIGGAPSNTTGNYPEGYAMIYKWSGNNWMQKGSRLLGENNYDNFGNHNYSLNKKQITNRTSFAHPS